MKIRILKFFFVFWVILGISFSNLPFYALSGLLNSYMEGRGVVDKLWLLEQNHDSDVVDKFASIRDVTEKLRVHNAAAAVANDAKSESHTGTTGNTSAASFTWNHTPVGTPRGVLVFVFTFSATKKVTSVTYGGVAMTEITAAAAIDTTGEPGRVDTFFLGAGIGTGLKAVVVNRTNDTTVMYAQAITVTAAADTEVTGTVLLQNDGAFAVQSVNDGSTGINSVRYAAGFSGGSNVLVAGTGSTVLNSIDFGVYTLTTVRETTAGQGARNVGFTYATSDDRAGVHLAIREIVPPTTTLATGSDPAATTIAPGAAATDVDLFTLQTTSGTETLTSVTVNLSTNSGIGLLAITNNANTVLGSTASPATGSNVITVSGMTAGTSATTFKVRATPLSHVAMPVPAGGSYAITAPVTAWAGNYGNHAGSDTNPNALTIDNASPAGTTGLTPTAGNTQVDLGWSNPGDGDFQQVYIYCKTATMGSGEAPTEGADPTVDGTACNATAKLKYKGSISPQTISGLTNGTPYYFRIYARDSRGNFTAYSATQEVNATPSAPADVTAPTPNPMTFSSAPNNTSSSQIDMTATTATDATTPPVSYYFTLDTSVCTPANIGTGAADSGWQAGTAYSDTGLSVNKCYGYKVKARDSAGTPNETGYSGITTLYTSANTPSAPTVGSPTSNSLVITNNENGNPLSNPITLFAVQVTTSDGNWNNKWVDGSGNASVSEVWLNDTQLTSLTVNGLQASTLYNFAVKARNENSDQTSLSSTGSGTTSAAPPNITGYTNTETGLNNLGGRVGQTITVSGTSFGTDPGVGNYSTAANHLTIGAYQIPTGNVTSWSSTQIVFSIPSAITSYGTALTITAGSQSDSTPPSFKVYPDITSLSVSEAKEGDTIATITGTRFGSGAGASAVTIDGVAATGCTWADTSITGCVVPAGINDSNNSVTVRVHQGTGGDNAIYDDSGSFTILPKITGTTDVPTGTADAAREYSASDSEGVFTILGNHFGVGGTITILGGASNQQTTATCSGTAYQATCVGLRVPDVAGYTGSIIITRTSDSKTNTYPSFRVLPRITSTSPVNSKGGRGDIISITGDHLCQDTSCVGSPEASEDITFNGISGETGSSWSSGSITNITIPASATDGNLIITSDGDGAGTFTSNSLSFDVKFAPSTPTNGVPTGQSDIGLNPTINGSAFSDTNDSPQDSHSDSDWQIDEEGTFVSPEWSETLSTNNTSVIINDTNGTFANNLAGQTALGCGKTYSFRERYKDNAGVTSAEWSSWSTGSTFSTGACAPGASLFTNDTEGGLDNLGGRIGQTITLSGTSFGTVANGSQANCAGGAGTGCIQISGYTIPDANIGTWVPTSIDFTIPAGITVYGTTITVTSASQADPTPLTFKVYPNITSLSVSEAKEGDAIATISGTRFGTGAGANAVTIDGVTATGCTWGDLSITGCIVPTGINDANNSVTVRVYQGTGGDNTLYDESTGFTILPKITGTTQANCSSLSTDSAREYDANDTVCGNGLKEGQITVNGNHFGTPNGTNPLTILGSNTSGYSTWEASQITLAQIPIAISDSSYTGSIVLTRNDAKAYTYAGFRVLPRITGIVPSSGVVSDSVTINGNHFCQAGSASCPSSFNADNKVTFFFGVDATIFTSWTNTAMSTEVPSGAQTGNVVLKSNTYDSNGENFTISSPVPNDPTALGQFKNSGLTQTISVGGGASSTPIYLSMTMEAGVSGGTLYPQVEYKITGTGFTCSGGGACGSAMEGTGASGPGPTVDKVVVSPSDGNYHWQARVRHLKNSNSYYSNWVSYGGNGEGAADFSIDGTAPTITVGPSSSGVQSNSATITWTTGGETSTTRVQYNKTGTFGACGTDCTTYDPTLTFDHTVNLINLDSGTTYYYRVRSQDSAGNETVSSNGTFNTTSVTQPGKTTQFDAAGFETPILNTEGATTTTFLVHISEGTYTIKSAFVELTGISLDSGTNNIEVQVNGQASKTYAIASGESSFKILYNISSGNVNLDPSTNTLSITVSKDTSIASAKIFVTYAYTP